MLSIGIIPRSIRHSHGMWNVLSAHPVLVIAFPTTTVDVHEADLRDNRSLGQYHQLTIPILSRR
jgi:hypothetical protein